jgi:chromate transporter
MNIYFAAFLSFFKIGTFTIGGGYAMIPLIKKEVVEVKRWLTKEDFLDIIALSQSLPGILAINVAIFVGYRLKGTRGSLVTALGTALPSFLIILLIAIFFESYKNNALVEAVFKGIRPAVVALIAVPVFNLAKAAKLTYKTFFIPCVAALFIWLLGISPIWVILVAGVGGFLYGKLKRKEHKE